jgi:transposase
MRLDEAPGVGPVLAAAVVAAVADPKSFRRAQLLGLDRYRAETGSAISANKATAICAACLWPARFLSSVTPRSMATKHRPWLTALLARRPTKVAAIALANKIARMVWAMMARGERYKEPVALAA